MPERETSKVVAISWLPVDSATHCADANGSGDQRAAFLTAILRALVCGRSRGGGSVVALFGDKFFSYRVHFRDDLFFDNFGDAGIFAVGERRRIVGRGRGGFAG